MTDLECRFAHFVALRYISLRFLFFVLLIDQVAQIFLSMVIQYV